MIISCRKDLEHNPLVQEVCDNGKPLIYGEKLVFNKSFIPQTWVSDEQGGDGCPLDLVDLSAKGPKPVMSVSNFRILGVLGLIDRG